MKKLNAFFESTTKINLLLFVCSFGIYFLYFHTQFSALNATLSSITADSLKNYYTFVYHIKNDASALQFSGMNYPYGEHIIYTDCQPILTFALRVLPFTHNHLIGILHFLIFFSFIVTPLILNQVLKLLAIDKFSSFFIALSLALLSPQFVKINAGHFALAYGCIIPLALLLVLKCLRERRLKSLLGLFIFNSALFLLHPYLGFCLSVFSFLVLLSFDLLSFDRKTLLPSLLRSLFAGILPLLLFKLFMALTDHHLNRTTEPYGAEVMVENIDTLVSPTFGPFQKLMEYFFSNRTSHYEGHTYLGFFTVLLFLFFLISLPFVFKKLRIQKEMLVLLLGSVFFLLIAFGVHIKILNYFQIQSALLNQFRAVCRFAWIFYFTLPIFLVSVLYHTLKGHLRPQVFSKFILIFPLLFFCFNMAEANSYFTVDNQVFWKHRNFFHEEFLNQEEKKILSNLRTQKPQAILPLPLFHGGSEMFERLGSNNSMIPAMIYSYHSGIPITSVLLSRTSLTETKDLIELLNSYKKNKPIEKLLSSKDFFVLTTHDALLPDESRLAPHVEQFDHNDSLAFGYISIEKLLSRKIEKEVQVIKTENIAIPDSNNLIFIPYENRKPFLSANIMDYETVFVLDSNKLKTGSYVVSFHYHYSQNTYRAIASNFIVNLSHTNHSGWEYNIPIRCLSGFYEGFGVFEYRINLKTENKYDFILKGFTDQSYKISNFMIRPEFKSIISFDAHKDTLINNFPFSSK